MYEIHPLQSGSFLIFAKSLVIAYVMIGVDNGMLGVTSGGPLHCSSIVATWPKVMESLPDNKSAKINHAYEQELKRKLFAAQLPHPLSP